MIARDLMETEVVAALEDESASDLTDRFAQAHVHGAPVIDRQGRLVGMVSLEDILIGGMSGSADAGPGDAASSPEVREIMTSPAISADEETPVEDLCRMMWRFRIHHIPIVDGDRVSGMVSSLDVCRAVAERKLTD